MSTVIEERLRAIDLKLREIVNKAEKAKNFGSDINYWPRPPAADVGFPRKELDALASALAIDPTNSTLLSSLDNLESLVANDLSGPGISTLLPEKRTRINALHTTLLGLDDQITDAIEALGTLLASRNAAAAERLALTVYVMKYRNGLKRPSAGDSAPDDPALQDSFRQGLASALWRSGVGPALQGQPVTQPPVGDPFRSGDIGAAMATVATRHQQRLAVQIDTAVAQAVVTY